MVFIFVFMIMLCLADFVSDRFLDIVRRVRAPRAPIVRARQYRFN